jgi:hypothetical protein
VAVRTPALDVREQAKSLLIGRDHADEVIRKRERRGGTDSWHVATDAILTLLPDGMPALICVATAALTIVRIRARRAAR